MSENTENTENTANTANTTNTANTENTTNTANTENTDIGVSVAEPTTSVEDPSISSNVVNVDQKIAVEILTEALRTPNNSNSELENNIDETTNDTTNDTTTDEITVVVAESTEPDDNNTTAEESNSVDDLDLDPEELVESVESIYLELKNSVSGLGINPANYIVIVTKVIEKVEKVKSLSGDESLQLAMDVLSKLVDDVPNLTDTDRRYLDATIPGMIRTIISNSKSGAKFRTSKKALKKAYRKGMDKINPVQISEDILHKIVVVIEKKNYNASYICSNLIVMASMVMTMVEKYPTLSGMEKKNIVVKVLNQLVEKLPSMFDSVDPEDVALLKQSLKSLPDMIDTIVAVGNNKFEINQGNIIKTAGMLISMITPCIKTCKK